MSEGITVPLGDELPLSFTLPAGASGFFPQAFVEDDTDTPVAGSPFDLTEVGATARYTRFPAASFTPGAVGSFTARFVVFSDAGHLVEALQFTRDQDSFEVLPTTAEIADAVWDEILTGATHNIVNSAGRRLRELSDFGIRDEGQAQAGGATTITLAATAPTLDDVLVGGYVVITGGLGAGQVRVVLAYDGTTKIATVDRAWLINPDATSEYVVGLAADSIPVSDLFNVIRDAILSDGVPFPGANIDTTISSRSTVAGIAANLSGTHGAGSWEGNPNNTVNVGWARLDATTIEVTISARRSGADTPLLTAAIEFFNSNGSSRFLTAGPGVPDAQGVIRFSFGNTLIVQASYWRATVTDATGAITTTGHVPFTF